MSGQGKTLNSSTSSSWRGHAQAQRLPATFFHPKSTVELNLKLFKEQEDCDVFFVVGSNKVRVGAHRIILKGRSPVFKTMFAQRWETNSKDDAGTTTTIPLPDADVGAFTSFLKYIYADLFTNNIVDAMKFLQFADMYDVQPLVSLCVQLMAKELKLEDGLQVFKTARTYSLTTLMNQAGDLMASQFVKLSQLHTFDQVDEETLMYLLKRNDLHVEESELFSILLKWADAQIEKSAQESAITRGELLVNLIPLVRFPTMTATEFAEVVAPTNLLPPQTALNLFMYLNSYEETRKAIGSSLPYSMTLREGAGLVMDLYKECARPGNGTYRASSMEMVTNGQDILGFRFSGHSLPTRTKKLRAKICSLKLRAPKYDSQVFPNCTQQLEAMNSPIKIRITLSQVDEAATNATLEMELKDTMELVLDDPWELISDQMYKLTVSFQSPVYAVPTQLDDGGYYEVARDEFMDIFSSTTLARDVVQKNSVGTVTLSEITMWGSGTGQAFYHIPSGLHVVRSVKIALG